MKIISKLFVAILLITVASMSSAFTGRHGPSSGGHSYSNRRYQGGYGYRGGYGNYIGGVIGAVVIGTMIADQYPVEPQVVIPSIRYVPSTVRCDGGIFINRIYYCPVTN